MLVLKKMNIHILFTHWFLSDFPFLTEEHPLGFKGTAVGFKPKIGIYNHLIFNFL